MTDNISRRENLEREYEDVLFSLIVDRVMEKEADQLIAENERLKNDPNFVISKSMDDKCLDAIHERYNDRKRKRNTSRFRSIAMRAAIFIGVLLIAAAIPIFSVSALRTASINRIVRIFGRETVITADNNADNVDPISVLKSPSWFPAGAWRVVFVADEVTVYLVRYEDADENAIVYSEIPAEGSTLSIDTEDSDVKTDVFVNNYKAILAIKEGRTIVTWIDDQNELFCTLEVYGPEEITNSKTVLKIAESIK